MQLFQRLELKILPHKPHACAWTDAELFVIIGDGLWFCVPNDNDDDDADKCEDDETFEIIINYGFSCEDDTFS